MGENTNIEWCSHTFNPWRGCTKVSPGCANCYAEAMSKRNPAVLGVWGDNGTRVVAVDSYWKQPLKWNRDAEKAGERRRVFCASLADVFEDHPAIEPGWRADLGQVIQNTPQLDWLLLTKRPENVYRMLPDFWINFYEPYGMPKNVWIGTTVENQEQADKRISELLKIPASVRFLSCEPMLGPIDLTNVGPERWDVLHGWKPASENYPEGANTSRVDWVICGGESGPNARPMQTIWAQALRDQCQAAGVPFLFKQWGEYLPDNQNPKVGSGISPEYTGAVKIGKKNAGRLLDGVEWNQYPVPKMTKKEAA